MMVLINDGRAGCAPTLNVMWRHITLKAGDDPNSTDEIQDVGITLHYQWVGAD